MTSCELLLARVAIINGDEEAALHPFRDLVQVVERR
jgi:hypothetical protein